MRVPSFAPFVALGLSVLPATGVAAHGGTGELQTLASAVANELANSQLDGATQDEVRALLERSLALVRGSKGRRGADACVDFAMPIYEKQWQPATALEKAMALCEYRTDTELLRVAYPVYGRVLQPASALEKAVDLAQRKNLWGKAALVEYAKARLSKVFQEVDALEKAAAHAASVGTDAAPCVQRAYETYSKQFDVQPSLAKSFGACSAGE